MRSCGRSLRTHVVPGSLSRFPTLCSGNPHLSFKFQISIFSIADLTATLHNRCTDIKASMMHHGKVETNDHMLYLVCCPSLQPRQGPCNPPEHTLIPTLKPLQLPLKPNLTENHITSKTSPHVASCIHVPVDTGTHDNNNSSSINNNNETWCPQTQRPRTAALGEGRRGSASKTSCWGGSQRTGGSMYPRRCRPYLPKSLLR